MKSESEKLDILIRELRERANRAKNDGAEIENAILRAAEAAVKAAEEMKAGALRATAEANKIEEEAKAKLEEAIKKIEKAQQLVRGEYQPLIKELFEEPRIHLSESIGTVGAKLSEHFGIVSAKILSSSRKGFILGLAVSGLILIWQEYGQRELVAAQKALSEDQQGLVSNLDQVNSSQIESVNALRSSLESLKTEMAALSAELQGLARTVATKEELSNQGKATRDFIGPAAQFIQNEMERRTLATRIKNSLPKGSIGGTSPKKAEIADLYRCFLVNSLQGQPNLRYSILLSAMTDAGLPVNSLGIQEQNLADWDKEMRLLYAEMRKRVSKVKPAGAKIDPDHGILARYSIADSTRSLTKCVFENVTYRELSALATAHTASIESRLKYNGFRF